MSEGAQTMMLQLVRIALQAVGQRLLTFVTMVLCGVAFAWALHDPTIERGAVACAFALLVFWPVVYLDIRSKGSTDEAR
jgi:hypothetical protein